MESQSVVLYPGLDLTQAKTEDIERLEELHEKFELTAVGPGGT